MADWVRGEYAKALREAERHAQEAKNLEKKAQELKAQRTTQSCMSQDTSKIDREIKKAQDAAKEARRKETEQRTKAILLATAIQGEGKEEKQRKIVNQEKQRKEQQHRQAQETAKQIAKQDAEARKKQQMEEKQRQEMEAAMAWHDRDQER